MNTFELLQSFFAKQKTSEELGVDPEEGGMTFLDHLEELRRSIIKAIIGLLIATVICAFFTDFIVTRILLQPLTDVGLKVQTLEVYGKFMFYMESMLICGFILSMPNTLYWLWDFVAPGLYPNERRYIFAIVMFTALCFFAGVAFGYFVLIPAAMKFFATFGTDQIQLNIAVDKYVSFLLSLVVGAGLVFELPMLSYFLAKMGILSASFMRKYRRHAIMAILVIAAIVTPTPDILTQSLLAAPMYLLYEVSIFIVAAVARKKLRKEQAES